MLTPTSTLEKMKPKVNKTQAAQLFCLITFTSIKVMLAWDTDVKITISVISEKFYRFPAAVKLISAPNFILRPDFRTFSSSR